MPTRIDTRKVSLTMAIVVAMIAVALPLCQMVGCDMLASAMGQSTGTAAHRICNLGSMAAPGSVGVVPTGSESLIFSLAALIGVAIMIVSPPRQLQLVRASGQDPPPPPEDPRGVRLII